MTPSGISRIRPHDGHAYGFTNFLILSATAYAIVRDSTDSSNAVTYHIAAIDNKTQLIVRVFLKIINTRY